MKVARSWPCGILSGSRVKGISVVLATVTSGTNGTVALQISQWF